MPKNETIYISSNNKLMQFWDERNKIDPSETSSGSHKVAKFKCTKNHTWEQIIRSFAKILDCPSCSGKKAIPGETDIGTLFPQLEIEWNDDKVIKNFLPNSGYKAQWKCALGHEWNSTIEKRVNRNQKCPVCSNRKILSGYNDLKTRFPQLIEEWNDDTEMFAHLPNSIYKAQWKCNSGHKWKTQIGIRTRGFNCPYCSGKKAIYGINDLGTKYPHLTEEWNDSTEISEYTVKSGYKAEWKCIKGHIWKAIISDRTSGKGCAVCSNKKVLAGYNDLASTHPELVKQWHDTKILPTEVTYGSKKVVNWICEYGHIWNMMVSSRAVSGQNCPYCNGVRLGVGINDLATTHPEIAKEWYDEKNIEEFGKSSKYRAKWICQKGHITNKKIVVKVNYPKCNVCENREITVGINDLATTHPVLIQEWNDSRKPSNFKANSNDKIKWKCALGHSWITTIQKKIKGTKCTVCSNRKIVIGINDLATTHPELAKEWNGDKAKIGYSAGSDYDAEWVCELGHTWMAKINDRVSKNIGCPYCSGNRFLKGFNDVASQLPHVLSEWQDPRDPSTIRDKSIQKLLWRCSKGHFWKASAYRRQLGFNCVICAKQKPKNGKTLKDLIPNIDKYYSVNNKFNPEDYAAKTTRYAKFICRVSGKEYSKRVRDFAKFYPHCACKSCVSIRSKPEKDLAAFISSIGYTIIISDRSIIKPLELDIVVPEKKVAFEFNGTYWHSDEVVQANKGMSSYDFHKLKKDLAMAAGYELFFVWEDDWCTDSQAVKTAISAALCGDSTGVDIGLLTRLS